MHGKVSLGNLTVLKAPHVCRILAFFPLHFLPTPEKDKVKKKSKINTMHFIKSWFFSYLCNFDYNMVWGRGDM